MIDPRRVTDRRRLSFANLDDVVADAEALGGGEIRTTGNWTAPLIVQHVARLIGHSIDGFPATAPWYVRRAGRLFKKRALRGPMPPGFNFGPKMPFLAPDEDVTWAAAVELLRANAHRARTQEMSVASPILGPMTHEDWTRFHCRHAELHFSFMHPAS